MDHQDLLQVDRLRIPEPIIHNYFLMLLTTRVKMRCTTYIAVSGLAPIDE
jgi:hypothetical protein